MTIVSRTSWCNTRARDPWLGTFVCLRCHRVRFVPGLVSKHPAFVPVGRVEGVWFVFNCYVRKHGSYCGFNCIEFVTVGGVNLDGVGRACSLGLLCRLPRFRRLVAGGKVSDRVLADDVEEGGRTAAYVGGPRVLAS